MNSLTRIMSYDKTKINQENCNCSNFKVENQTVEYPPLTEKEIEQIIKERYDYKDEKTKKFIRKALRKHGDRYDYSNVIYIKNFEKVEIICRVEGHKSFWMRPSCHYLRGQGCSYCSGKHHYTTDEFIKQANEIYGVGRYDYSRVKYVNRNIKVIIICHNHDESYVFEQTPTNHLSGHGCKKCQYEKISKEQKLTLKEFIEKSRKVHGNKYDYSKVKYVSANLKVIITCLKHGDFKQTPNKHLNGQGCPICKSSKGEGKVRKFLTENKIEFEEQKRFNDCRNKNPLPFDFYLPQYNLCIEYDGIQHFNPNSFNSKKESEIKKLENFKIIQFHDQIKNEYCNSHNINLLRIRYNENVEEKLNKYFQEHNVKILTDVSFYKEWFEENCKDLIIEQNH